MPRPVQWYSRIEPALTVLREETAELLTRNYIEGLLGVSERQANRIMQLVGYAETKPDWLVERRRVIRTLEKILGTTEFQVFEERQVKIATEVEKKRLKELAAKVTVPFNPLLLGTTLATLPDGVKVERGKVTVEAATAEEIVGGLYQLALALANDIERFRTALEGE